MAAKVISANRTTSVTLITRMELWLIGGLVLLGAAFRAWGLPSLGLIHFDEGAYAISGLWTVSPGLPLYFKQVLFAPPLYFSLIGASYRLLGGGSDTAAVLVNVVIGTLTIALVWWVARQWFGREAGIAAAVWVTFSDYHIAYSRMVLTDITFGFLYLLSLALIAVTLERKSFRWAVLSGLAIGAAWNTKYHGWLLLVVALMALVASPVLMRRGKSSWKRRFACWVVMAAVAGVCYLPWVAYVQAFPGGYLSLLRYQRGYVNRDWLHNFWRHVQLQGYMDGWVSRFSPALAYLFVLAVRKDGWRLGWRAICLVAVVLVGVGMVLGGAGAAVAMGVLAIGTQVRRGSFPHWLFLGSLGLLSLMTPAYRPYPRLLLPWLLSAYMAAGATIDQVLVDRVTTWAKRWISRPSRRALWALPAAILLVGALGLAVGGGRPTLRTWMASNSLRDATAAMARVLPENSTVLVHGEPAVVFYLKSDGHHAIPIDHPIDHPEVEVRFGPSEANIFLVTSIYAQHRDPGSRASLERLQDRLHLVQVFSFQPNDVRLLNDFTPADALRYRRHPTNEYNLYLYRIEPTL